jgi:hypothetical protein
MTRAQEIAAGLRGLREGESIGEFHHLVADALAELLDPVVQQIPRRPETLLLGYTEAQWRDLPLTDAEFDLIEQAFQSRTFAEAHLAALVAALEAARTRRDTDI